MSNKRDTMINKCNHLNTYTKRFNLVCELSIFFNIDIYIDTNVNATRKLNATIVARLSPGYMVNIVVSC